jgi:hypothetical protein
MPKFTSNYLWKNDIIDRIFVYSANKKKKTKDNFNFQLASFSIQTIIKIYSDRIKALSIYMEDFLYHLEKNKNKIRNENIKSKYSIKLNVFKYLLMFERLIMSYSLNKNITGSIIIRKFNFNTIEFFYKKIFLKKNKHLFWTLEYQLSFNFPFKQIILDFFKLRIKQNIKGEEIFEDYVLQVLKLEKIKINHIIYVKKRKKFETKLDIICKGRKLKKIKKILKTIETIKGYIVFLKNKNLNKFISKSLDKSNSIVNFLNFKKEIGLKKTIRKILFIYIKSVFYKKPSTLIFILENLDSIFKIKSESEKKEIPCYNFKFFLNNHLIQIKKNYNLFTKNRNNKANNFIILKKDFFDNQGKIFGSLVKNYKKFFFEIIENKKSILHRNQINLVEYSYLKFFKLKSILNIKNNLFFLKERCCFLFSNFFLETKINMGFLKKQTLKKKIFDFLNHLIYQLNKKKLQILLKANMDQILIVSHEIKKK